MAKSGLQKYLIFRKNFSAIFGIPNLLNTIGFNFSYFYPLKIGTSSIGWKKAAGRLHIAYVYVYDRNCRTFKLELKTMVVMIKCVCAVNNPLAINIIQLSTNPYVSMIPPSSRPCTPQPMRDRETAQCTPQPMRDWERGKSAKY